VSGACDGDDEQRTRDGGVVLEHWKGGAGETTKARRLFLHPQNWRERERWGGELRAQALGNWVEGTHSASPSAAAALGFDALKAALPILLSRRRERAPYILPPSLAPPTIWPIQMQTYVMSCWSWSKKTGNGAGPGVQQATKRCVRRRAMRSTADSTSACCNAVNGDQHNEPVEQKLYGKWDRSIEVCSVFFVRFSPKSGGGIQGEFLWFL
jgi:hypothetical protein